MWVLREELESKRQDHSIYFKGLSAIGPACTDDIDEAHRFESRQDAVQSVAYSHAWSFFEPLEISE